MSSTCTSAIAIVALAVAAAAAGCGSSRPMVTPPPTNAPAIAVDLGPGLLPVGFAAGRYAHVVARELHGTHAMQWVRESSAASLVVDLAADGSATVCRGWRYDFTNDGPEVHTEDRWDEQQGYRGRYVVHDGVAEVTLAADDGVCAHRYETTLEIPRARAVTLRCVRATPRGERRLTPDLLACQWLGEASEAEPHRVRELAPRGWIVLGGGHGLQVTITGKAPGARMGDPTVVTAEPAPAPLGIDAWEQPFPRPPR